MSNIDNNITPAQLLTAAREGHITAAIKDAQTLEPLAGGDGPEQYPACTIALLVNGEEIREVQAWKLVYYSTEGDTLNGGHGTYDFRDVRSDGCTRGDVEVSIDDGDGEDLLEIIISTGEGMPNVGVISVDGLTAEEAEEIREAIESAIEEVYADWTPEHPDAEEIYAALVGKKRETTTIDADVAGEEISVKLYAGTHCGKPQYAYEGDESETVYEDEDECAKAARERMEEIFAEAVEKSTTVEATITEAGNGFPSDGGLVYDSTGNTVYEVVSTGNIQTGRSSGAGNWVLATLKEVEGAGSDPTNYSDDEWEAVSDCSISVHDAPEIDEEALDKEEREAAEMLREALTDRD